MKLNDVQKNLKSSVSSSSSIETRILIEDATRESKKPGSTWHDPALPISSKEAGVSDHLWSLEEIAGLAKEPEPKKRGPYKKRNSN